MEEEKVTAPEEKKEEVVPLEVRIRGILGKHPNAPSTLTIDDWKVKYGDVFISAFSDDELFLFRPLNRKEYLDLQKRAMSQEITPEDHELETVTTCMLWTSVKDITLKAGNVPTLLEQILQNSNFVPPQLASQFVGKL